MKALLNALKSIWTKYKSQILMGLGILICVFFLIRSCENSVQSRHIYDNNVKALTEEVETWKTKTGDLVAEKTVLEGDYKLLKQTNEDLYEQVKKLKAKPKEVVYVQTEIINEVHDTTFQFLPDSCNYLKQKFDFSDKFRKLDGFIEWNKPNLGLTITNDITYADFTVAIRDSRVFVTSNNPHIVYNDIQGVVLPKTQPRWSIGIGPSITAGYDILHKNFAVTAGISVNLNYNLISWGQKMK